MMQEYSYIAMTRYGQVVRGHISAHSTDDAALRLKEQGLNMVRLSTTPSGRIRHILAQDISFRSPLRAEEDILLLSTLADLLEAGMPMTRALELCADVQKRKAAKIIVKNIAEHIQQGKPLSTAMALQHKCFDARVLALILAGEESGQLAPALLNIAKNREQRHKQMRKIKGALYYPAFLLVMTFLSIALLVGYVLPQFEPLFQQAGAELPAITRGVQFFAASTVYYGPWASLLALLAIVFLGLARRKAHMGIKIDRAILNLPLIGGIIRLSSLSSLCHTIGTQLTHGVPIERALQLAEKTQTNLALRHSTTTITDKVRRGQSLSHSFKSEDLYPDLLISLLKVGEESGNLPRAFLRVAQMTDVRLEEQTERLTSLMTPLITLVLGGVIGLIVFAVMAAVMGVTKLA